VRIFLIIFFKRFLRVDLHPFRILSLCSGVGGIELGFKLAEPTARTICYVEIEAFACSILAKRMEEKRLDQAPIWTNLKTFDGKPWRGVVDCITGGYPCQPFSVAGKKLGNKDPRHLWPDIKRLIQEIQPPICFFENVSNHLRVGFEEVANDLRQLGYQIKAGLFTAAEVGAPHKRERLFILACRSNENMANSQNILFQWHKQQRSKSRKSKAEIGGNDSKLGNTNGKRLEGQCQCKYPNQLPTWPPRPADNEGWNAVPNHLKPALHRMADGMACRVDRIRACGNGVVPLVAAYAWRTLTNGMYLTKNN
jgi:DNA (cytosine-5)-methyltransferase 1